MSESTLIFIFLVGFMLAANVVALCIDQLVDELPDDEPDEYV